MPTDPHARALDIRPAEPSDLAALQEIRRAAFAPIFAAFRAQVGASVADVVFAAADAEQAALLQQLCAPGSPSEVYAVRRRGEMVGFVSVTLDRRRKVGEIGLNAVRPDAAGAGVGAEMYAFALARMRAAGMRAAEVSTGDDAAHAPARRAYEKAGFVPGIPSMTFYRAL